MRRAIMFALGLAACQDAAVSRQLGARCGTPDECDDRCLPASVDYPAGFCTVECDSSSECPGDAACVADEGGSCLFTCSDDDDCGFLGETWACQDRASRGQLTKVSVCRGR
ncbi:MAG: hypothetical protein WKG01_05410 [Kofleriaceae bacterium]